MRVKVGDKAPDFTLPSQTGEKVSLSNFLSKKNVVLFFYPMDESRECTEEACSFRDNYSVFKEMGAEVIGVSSDDVESHKIFAKECHLPFLLLSDENDDVRNHYGVPSTVGIIPGRVTYVIDKNGVVKYVFSSQFQPEKHVEEAIKVLEKL